MTMRRIAALPGRCTTVLSPFLVLFLLSIVACSSAPGSPADATLVLRGRVIDGTGAPPVERGVVVLAGDRIVCVGLAEVCAVPDDVEVIDVGDGTILPGLIDLHVHARPHYLGWFLAAGVTTVRDANNSLNTVDGLLDAGPHRPRIVWSGPMLDGPETVMSFFGEAGVLSPLEPDLGHAFTLAVATPDEARAAVDTLAARGASFIKLYEQLPPEAFRAATQRAHEHGLGVMTDLGMHHTRGLSSASIDALQAAAAGATTIEHAGGFALAYQRLGGDPTRLPYDGTLLDTLAGRTVESRAAVVPTFSAMYGFADDATDVSGLPIGEHFDALDDDNRAFYESGTARLSEANRAAMRLSFELAAEIVRRVHERGGTIGAGSDSPAGIYNLPGGGIHRELELLVRVGLTPVQAIHAATGAAASILGRSDLGVLREGALADLLVVEGNPAMDITATRRIHRVFRDGTLVPIEELVPGAE